MPGAVAEILAREFAGPVAIREGDFGITANAVRQILGNNPERLAYLIVNTQVAELSVGFGPSLSTTRRIILAANGGSLSVDVRDDFSLASHEVFGLSLASPGLMYLVEVVRDSGRREEP